jgi:hypothetical protein
MNRKSLLIVGITAVWLAVMGRDYVFTEYGKR